MGSTKKAAKPAKKTAKLKNLSAAVSSRKASVVKGGRGDPGRLSSNHNQSLRAR